jgi:hypothetical protein
MSVFCTLFDSNYLSRGLALYESLKRQCEVFHLYIFPFDEACLDILQKLNLSHVTIVPLSEFEDPELLSIKPQRSRAEYCWTCTPSTVLYVLDKYRPDMCTYLDADTYFFASPAILLDELQGNSVMITEHRFSPGHDKIETSGKYNVQFMVFKNNSEAKTVLCWWRNACIESCELNPEKGKCGDQKYLDEWTTMFSGVHELQHLGGGVAPWNVDQYRFFEKKQEIFGEEYRAKKIFDLIFYHFHALRFFENGFVQLTNSNYYLSRQVVELVYTPYIIELESIKEKVLQINPTIDPCGARGQFETDHSISGLIKKLFNNVKRTFYKNSRNYNSVYSNNAIKRGKL